MSATDVDGFSTASTMMRALRARNISAVELLELHLQRIERYNPILNAIVIPNYTEARLAAAAADTARARGEDRALLGLPLTIKDAIDVEGLPTTAGVPDRAEARAKGDARLTARVRAAGAVIVGKTNVPSLLADWQSSNPVFGRTNNPWDLERTPGGSTGGGAAALAAGLTPLEFGSDIGGSIRVPAAWCGVYGHRPSQTAVPRNGHFPDWLFLNVLGPLARSATDLSLAFDVVAGPEVGEDTAWRLDALPPRAERLADLRVAVMPPIDWLPVDAEIQAAQHNLAAMLSRMGATVKVTQPEGFGDFRRHHELYLSLVFATITAGVPEEQRRGLVEVVQASGIAFGEAVARGLEASASDYLVWLTEREAYRAAFRAFFREWDILVAPITVVPALPHGPVPWPALVTILPRHLEVNGQTTDYLNLLVYPAVAILSGQPATVFPVGTTGSGLPIGLQAIGSYLEDHTPIRFADLLSDQIGGFRRPPAFDEA